MNKLIISAATCALLAGCSSIAPQSKWVAEKTTDSFYGTSACAVKFNDAMQNMPLAYGVRYYPFVAKDADGNDLFGIGNNYNLPVGDVLVKIDSNEPIRISQSETQVKQGASYSIPGSSDNPAIQQAVNNAMKMSSPYTTASKEKSATIINEMKSGKTLMVRVIGLGVNSSTASTDGTYALDETLSSGLLQCGI